MVNNIVVAAAIFAVDLRKDYKVYQEVSFYLM